MKDDRIWAYLIHLGFNFWADREAPEWNLPHITARPYMRFNRELWERLIPKFAEAGINTLVIDLGEGVRYESHPELAARDAWTVKELKAELAHLRNLGIEPIPKMNFSACHDVWLGPYSRMLSTDTYYGVCRDLIQEAIEIFDKPRLFHLGMDEETAAHQAMYDYVVIRQHDLWWHDFLFLVEQVEKGGARAWIWSDYLWVHPDEFIAKMPKSVLQSNWYYGESFSPEISYVKAYLDLEKHGYDQVPTGSNWTVPTNFGDTVKFAKENIAPERLKGFLQTVWRPLLPDCFERHIRAIEQVGAAARSEFI
ncbi:MAG: Tat pathway signal protein [Armatimonadetes bacterium]|nr:Tat pathway signal protein [Armatimonadota bacterium]